jgi:hypothetical protein
MSAGSKGKKNLEDIKGLKGGGATAAEAQSAVLSLRLLTQDNDSPMDVRGTAARLAQELLEAESNTARREALMLQVSAFIARTV